METLLETLTQRMPSASDALHNAVDPVLGFHISSARSRAGGVRGWSGVQSQRTPIDQLNRPSRFWARKPLSMAPNHSDNGSFLGWLPYLKCPKEAHFDIRSRRRAVRVHPPSNCSLDVGRE